MPITQNVNSDNLVNLINLNERIITAEFKKLCEDTYSDLKIKIRAKTGNNKYLTDEIIQTTYEKAVLNREKLLVHPNPEGWLNKTAVNIYYKLRDKINKTVQNETEYTEYIEYTSNYYLTIDFLNDEKNSKEIEAELLMKEMLTSLTKKEKELIKYQFYNDLSLKEIAVKWNANYESVRKLNFRLLKKAKKIFLSRYPDYHNYFDR